MIRIITKETIKFGALIVIVAILAMLGMSSMGRKIIATERDSSECLHRGFDQTKYLSDIGEVWCVGLRNGNTVTDRLR